MKCFRIFHENLHCRRSQPKSSISFQEPHSLVLVLIGGRTIAVTPDGDTDLGVLRPQDEIAVAKAATPEGLCYRVTVERAAH